MESLRQAETFSPADILSAGAMCFIYTLHASNDPECRPRYVGFTINPKKRSYQHNSTQSSGRKKLWAQEVRASGGKVILTIVFRFRSDCATERGIVEGGFVALYKNRFPDLLNEGGIGNGVASCSASHRASISRGNKGKKKSPEHAAKCRVARLGIPHTPEIRKKISESGKGKKRTLEQLERYRNAARKRYADPVQKAKFDAARKLRHTK